MIKSKRPLQNSAQIVSKAISASPDTYLHHSVKASFSSSFTVLKGSWLALLSFTLSFLTGCCCPCSNSSQCCPNRPYPTKKICAFKPVCNPREHPYGVPHAGNNTPDTDIILNTECLENLEEPEDQTIF